MKNFKIRNKVLLPMMVLLLAVTGANAFQIYAMEKLNDQLVEVSDVWLPSIEALALIDDAFTDMRVNQYAAFNAVTEESNHKYEAAIEKNIVELKKAMQDYAALIFNDEERTLYNDIEKGLNSAFEQTKVMSGKIDAGLKDEALAMLDGPSQKGYDSTSATISKLDEYNRTAADKTSVYAHKLSANMKVASATVTLAIMLFGIFTVFGLVRAIALPIRSVTDFMNYLAGGKLDKDVPYKEQRDEIGDMARSIQVFKDNMVRNLEMEEEAKKEQRAKLARQEKVDAATKRFEASMADIVKFVSSASTELQASAQSLAASAKETSQKSGAVAAASQQAAANVQTVASASEELSSSINEIAQQVTRSSEVAGKAVEDARMAGTSVTALVEAAHRIGDVTKIISDIAEQTNLLALNATIEAARAGDAGKGFAVVASEVKNLANESTKATEQISAQIQSIQETSQKSAESIDMICKIIEEMNAISGSISAAIQEQTAATQEISRNVSEAYSGTSEVTQNIGSVSEAATSTGSASHQVLSAADELAHQSDILKTEFESYIAEVAAA